MQKRYTIDEFRAEYPDNDACLDKIFQLRFNNLVCPKCEGTDPFKRVKGRRSYQCPKCGFQLYPTKDTIFEKTTTPLTYWFYAIYLQTTTRNGVAAKELERQLNICYHTALRMSHQIKRLMSNNDRETMKGDGRPIEIDETFMGGLIKNLSKSKRKAVKEHNKATNRKRDALQNKTVVLGILQRNGNVVTHIIDAATKEHVLPLINDRIEYAAEVFTDSSSIYRELHTQFFHCCVNHAQDEFVRGKVHTNTIEGFWSQLKRTIKGTHIHVSLKYLPLYMNEVAYRWTNRDKQDQMFNLALSRVVSA